MCPSSGFWTLPSHGPHAASCQTSSPSQSLAPCPKQESCADLTQNVTPDSLYLYLNKNWYKEVCTWTSTKSDTRTLVPLPQQNLTQTSLYLYLNKNWHKKVCTSTSTNTDTKKSAPMPQQKLIQASLYLYLNKSWHKQVCTSGSHKRKKSSIAWLCSNNIFFYSLIITNKNFKNR